MKKMKMAGYLLTAAFCVLLPTGCAAPGMGSGETESAQQSIQALTESSEATAHETEVSESADTESADAESAAEGAGTDGSTEEGQTTMQLLDAPPSWDHYVNPDKQLPEAPKKLVLTQVSAQSNGISMADDWLMQNQLQNEDNDGQYFYQTQEGGQYKGTQFGVRDVLEMYRISESSTKQYPERILDFSNYVFPDAEQDEEEKEFGEQEVVWAQTIGNILYVETGHYSYASTSNGKNAYLTAIDLNDLSVVWRSQPLVCNSRSFQIVNGVIVCGYGFTDEDDYLYEISTADGTVMDRIPLKKAADQIVCKDNLIYVHTYNTDYQFQISQE